MAWPGNDLTVAPGGRGALSARRLRTRPRALRAGIASLALAAAATASPLLINGAPAVAQSSITISIDTVVSCSLNAACFHPPSASGTVGTTVTWVNHSLFTQRVVADDGSFDTGDIANGSASGPVTPAVGTHTYHLAANAQITGTLTITAAATPPPPGKPPGPTGSGTVPSGVTTLPNGLPVNSSVTAGRPRIVASTPRFVPGPGTLLPPGSSALPPIDATASPDPSDLPPLTAPAATPRAGHLASAPTSTTTGGRPVWLYLSGAALFMAIALAGGGWYGYRWWRRRGEDLPEAAAPS